MSERAGAVPRTPPHDYTGKAATPSSSGGHSGSVGAASDCARADSHRETSSRSREASVENDSHEDDAKRQVGGGAGCPRLLRAHPVHSFHI